MAEQTQTCAAFVTGATGLVGSHLVERLVKEGLRPRCLVRPSSDTSFLKALGVDFALGDVTDPPEKLRQAIGDCRTVFHVAAMVDDWAPRDAMVRVNVDGTRNMIEACVGLPTLEKFVLVSSMVVLGMGPQNNLDETAPRVHTGDNYNYTKILAEEMALGYAQEKKVPVVVCRPPYIYGERDKQFFPRLFEPLRNGRFKFIGDGNQPITLICVHNLVEALLRASRVADAVGEVFLVTDGESISRHELVEMVCREMGYQRPKFHVPLWFAIPALPFVEWFAKVRGKAPILNRFKMKFMATPMTFNIGKARRVLGYAPLEPVHTSLQKTIRWYREHHPEMAAKA